MQEILKILNNNFKLYTCCQVGIDTTISALFSEMYDMTLFIDSNSDWSEKAYPKSISTEKLFYTEPSEVFEYLDYYSPRFDILYVHDRNSLDFQRKIINIFTKNKTKVILAHPNTFKFDSTGYSEISIKDEEGEYRLYYLDILYNAIDEYFKIDQPSRRQRNIKHKRN